MTSERPVLVTDLDGTVLNRFTYQWDGNEARLLSLIHAGIPVIFSSSKTAAEQQALCEDLSVPVPFFSENGSAFHVPVKWTILSPDAGEFEWKEIPLVPAGFSMDGARDQLEQLLPPEIRLMTRCTAEELASATGLTLGMAVRACQKNYSETLLFSSGEVNWSLPDEWLRSVKLIAEPGTRFVTLRHESAGKENAVYFLRGWLRQTQQKSFCLVAAGDGGNDLGMLSAADEGWWLGGVPVPDGLTSTREEGPAGFSEVTGYLLNWRGKDPMKNE